MKYSSDAGRWLAENGFRWNLPRKAKARAGQKRCGETPREIREEKRGLCPIREFVEENRTFCGSGCLFVPGSQVDVPAKIEWLGSMISAARYMALLTYGAPKSEKMVVRHTCGNGHLSCVNPDHLCWGSQGENIADANKHRKAERSGESKTLAI